MNKQLSNTEILEKALLKAVSNGYTHPSLLHINRAAIGYEVCPLAVEFRYKPMKLSLNDVRIFELIFSHEFAKAFWSEEPNIDTFGHHELSTPEWQCALMDMVLEEDPIQYLKQFLNE